MNLFIEQIENIGNRKIIKYIHPIGCMKDWVRKWLLEQREKGEVGLEVKELNTGFYVYRSTTYWDKELKKRRKKSTYLGVLDRKNGLVLSKQPIISASHIRTIWNYGTATILNYAIQELIPTLQEAFPDIWEEICVLTQVRMLGYVPLKRVGCTWDELYNSHSLSPTLNPKHLSEVLSWIGNNRQSQNQIFRYLSQSDNYLIYDLSAIFSRSEGISFNERGYNKNKIFLPQLNLALLCSAYDNLPAMIRVVPGSVRDISSLQRSIEEMNVEGKILILDTGFYSAKTLEFLVESKWSFIIPTKRNSEFYKSPITMPTHFFYHDRLIKAGKQGVQDFFCYRFEDSDLKTDEERSIYKQFDEGKLSIEKMKDSLEKAGNILMASNLDTDPKDIFLLYKRRDVVEKHYDSLKNSLEADRIYLQSDDTVFGHVFISFLALYGYTKIQNTLKKNGLINRYSPKDIFALYAKVKIVDFDGKMVVLEIPKKIADLTKKMNLDLFPKQPS